jgi:hypothetical protein
MNLSAISRLAIVLSAASGVQLGFSQELLFGNPQIAPGLTAQGYIIQASKNQTSSSSSVTYTVSAPANVPAVPIQMGKLIMQTVLAPGTAVSSVLITITYSGVVSVMGTGAFLFVGGQLAFTPSPQTIRTGLGTGQANLAFYVYPPGGYATQSTITVSFNLGGHQRLYQNDFDGDGQSDYAVFRPSEGNWYVSTSSFPNQIVTQWGLPGDAPVPGDFDGDGLADYAVWRPSNGYWFVKQSNGAMSSTQWGLPGDIPVPADYDGDGKTDLAIFRPSNGFWWIIYSSTGQQVAQQWGLPGDIPVPGDYDGDGKADLAIFRPSNGYWWVVYSSSRNQASEQWGLPGDTPVPGDFDGDGKTDVAVYRPSSGTWWVVYSSTGQQVVQQWGLSSDIPVIGTFSGNGSTNYSVWRPSTAFWWVSVLNNPFQWGLSTDIPIGRIITSAP